MPIVKLADQYRDKVVTGGALEIGATDYLAMRILVNSVETGEEVYLEADTEVTIVGRDVNPYRGDVDVWVIETNDGSRYLTSPGPGFGYAFN